jgi:hypothetical protein
MHGHHKDITKVDFLLTESSQMIEAVPEEGEQQGLAPSAKGASRLGMLRSLLGADHGFSCFRKRKVAAIHTL